MFVSYPVRELRIPSTIAYRVVRMRIKIATVGEFILRTKTRPLTPDEIQSGARPAPFSNATAAISPCKVTVPFSTTRPTAGRKLSM